MLRRLFPLCLLALSACSGATPLAEPTDAAAPADVAAPAVTITAAIASASLANDCPDTSSSAVAGDCARLASSDGGAGDSYCGGFCQQTGLQLTFTVAAVGTPSSTDPINAVRITSVRLLDAATDAPLDTLTARVPQRWEGAQYVTWDGNLRGYGDTRASFKLSAPDWNRIGNGEVWNTYSRAFRLEVTIVVNGETRVLRSGELMRAPEVVT